MHFLQKNDVFLARLPGILTNLNENYRRDITSTLSLIFENIRLPEKFTT